MDRAINKLEEHYVHLKISRVVIWREGLKKNKNENMKEYDRRSQKYSCVNRNIISY